MTARKVSLFFLFVANLIILAHAVIPHHHHEKAVCIISSHCSDDETSHSHVSDVSHHEHDGSSNSDNCTLKQVVVTPPNNNRGNTGFLAFDPDCTIHPDLIANFEWPELAISSLSACNNAQDFPDLPYRITDWIISGLGLRAPPQA